MPGPLLTLRALGGSNSTSTDIVTDARYQLARPDLVNGVPSLSLVSSNQACTVRTYIDGVFNTSLTVAATGVIPMLKASGAMLSAVELAALTFDVSGLQYAEVLRVTDEPAGSPSAPFTTTAELPASGAFVGDIKYVASPNVPCGMVRRQWCNGVWQTPSGETILQKTNHLSLLNPGSTANVVQPIATIPIGSVVDGEWELILGHEQGATNTGVDSLGLDANGSNIFSTGNTVAGAVVQIWSHHVRFVRMGAAIRIFYYQRLGTFVTAVSGITIDFSASVELAWRAAPGNGANNLYLRNVALKRIN